MKRTSLFTVIFALSMLFVFAAPASALVLNQDTCGGTWTWDPSHTTGICTINSGNVFVINEDITIDPDTVVDNFGSIIISAGATVYQQDTAIFNRDLGTIDNYGTFTNGGLANYGTINNKNGGIINNVTIDNYGTCGDIQPVDTSDGCENYKGIINNYGTFTFTNGMLYNNLNGTITNLGTITGSSTIINNGAINNTESGIIHNYNNFSNTGEIINNGKITNTLKFNNEDGSTINNTESGIIYNSFGNFSNTGVINNAGTIISSAGGCIRNEGGEPPCTVIGDFINDAEGVIFNNIGGTIENTVGMQIKNKGKIYNNFVIQNNGTIANDGNINNYYNIIGGNIINSGIITNARGIITNPHYYGLSIINSGSITNSGIISNFEIDNYGTIVNVGGTITIPKGSTTTNVNGGIITNNGGIITNNGGITNNADSTINNENGGIINNEENGNIINIGMFNNKATIYNKAGATIFNRGIFNNDGIIYNRNGANISNNIGGTIIDGGGTIVNEEGGNIANYGTITNDATGVITNRGTITNSGGTIDNSGIIRNLGTFTNEGTISNSGTIYSSTPIGGTITGTPPIIDNIAPTTTDDAPSTWQNANFTVTLTCTDNPGGSGCKETNYSIDGGDFKTGTSISINTEGDHLIEYYSIDILDNKEAVKSTHAKLDKTSGSISGMKFNDLNGNGIKDPGEPGLGGWQIDLNFTNGTVYETTTTAANGSYKFTRVQPGTYIVQEGLQPGWKQTAPAPIPPGTYTVIISSGNNVKDKDFGNRKYSIYGMKFNDKNGNGRRDVGEEGLAGWRMRLTGVDTLMTPVNKEAITDADGNYGFMDVNPGMYQVFEMIDVSKAGWVPTTPPTVPITNLKSIGGINVNFGNRKIS